MRRERRRGEEERGERREERGERRREERGERRDERQDGAVRWRDIREVKGKRESVNR